MSNLPRRFHLQRHTDVVGATGTGHVADGVVWPDGTATVHWRGEDNSDAFWSTGIPGIRRRSCHDGATEIVWDDPASDETADDEAVRPRRATDPRRPGGSIAGPGGPRDRHGVILSADRAVLLDASMVCEVEAGEQGTVLAMWLGGRINRSTERAQILYLLGADGAAAIVTELLALASRIGPDFERQLAERVQRLTDEGATGPADNEAEEDGTS
ncbi:hypothetical protein RM780_07730 [Streptomyces sp. DSM 44917]|uniref:Uncharacterized protein n=1 Tax=Streptomyces boetiae TaxID=3075541 RepID=A0ABU2L5S9_9ACTN|nr:hypothetical protein [Streptomyces sp. DSM 44917]MDT0306852.1 hypothetical protein [Streptomyces sp. DSM 44917]